MKVLIIEDNADITETIRVILEVRWPEVEIATADSGGKGLELARTEKPDIIILDIGLPDISGFEVLKKIRVFSRGPVLILTVKREEMDIVKGLESGADDYLIKPFHKLEFLARIWALVRRSSSDPADEALISGELRYNPATRQAFFGQKEIAVTATEGVILHELLKNAGRVVTYSRLAEAVWGENYQNAIEALWVYIRRLRKKIEENPEDPQRIVTKPGIGYLLKNPVN
jgi:two-component system, OmpR family, response regulator VicR